MERIRGFEIAKGFENQDIHLPIRKTKCSAGYDVEATLVKTGLKAYCPEDEYYMLVNRSSNPGKKGLILANSIGIIDSDYYGNESNDGHFMFAYYNFFEHDVQVKKGDVIGQVIFSKYFKVDNDNAEGIRTGGFGSTNK